MGRRFGGKWIFLALFVALLLGSQVHAASSRAPRHRARMLAVSLGGGKVALFWPPVLEFYTGGGWIIQDRTTGKTVARWSKKDLEKGLASLPGPRREKLSRFLQSLGRKGTKEAKSRVSLLLLGAMGDFKMARALGMACLLDHVPRGKRSYRLVVLDKRGRRVGRGLLSSPVDGWQVSPPPMSPGSLKGRTTSQGVELSWEVPGSKGIPTPFVQIVRKGQKKELITPELLWVPLRKGSRKATFVDTHAPLETRLTYYVRLVDVFGRLSEPASVTVFSQDLEALTPPLGIKAQAKSRKVVISWEPKENPYTAGYVLERSRRARGIYQVLTPKGLSGNTHSYEDKTVQEGFVYYYLVRSVGPRGEVGPAPYPVAVMVKPSRAPQAPTKLQARVEPTLVHLSWRAMPLPVAGYIVEKRKEDDGTWVRLNSNLVTMPFFEDPINLGDYGRRVYRVKAVVFGNLESKPSKEIEVKLPGYSPVPAPYLKEADSRGGVVKLLFAPSEPRDRTRSFIVIRGNSPRDLGLVIARGIKASNTTYEDILVKPGEDYWYALMAVDGEGHLSPMSNKVYVIVGSPTIPEPSTPKASFKEKPFHRVEITFAKPPGYLRVAVMRKVGQGSWVTIARDITGTDRVTDADPPLSGKVQYRVAYLDEAHHWGPPSEAVTLTLGR